MSLRSEVVRIFNELISSSKKISELPAAASVAGTDLVEISQGGASKKATVSQFPAGGGGGAVSSVFGRTGAVTAVANDYDASQISYTPAGNLSATTAEGAINELDTEKQAALGFTPEDVANKATDLTSPDNTKYPSTLAVSTALAAVTSPDASETVKGIIEIATQAETNTGTDDARALTPLKAATRYAPLASPALSGTPTVPTAAQGTNTTQAASTAYVQTEITDLDFILVQTLRNTFNF